MNITNSQFEAIEKALRLLPSGPAFNELSKDDRDIIIEADKTLLALQHKKRANNARAAEYIADKRAKNKDYARGGFKYIKAVYTGGGVWVFFGQHKDGYFLTDDNDGATILLDAPVDDLDVSLYAEWQEAHTIKALTPEESAAFCTKMLYSLKRRIGNIDRGGISDYEIDKRLVAWNEGRR